MLITFINVTFFRQHETRSRIFLFEKDVSQDFLVFIDFYKKTYFLCPSFDLYLKLHFIIIILLRANFSHQLLSSDVSLESESLQVSSGHQDSSEYLSQSQQFYHLDGFTSSSDFQFFQSLLQDIRECFECIKYDWYYLDSSSLSSASSYY